MFSLLRTGPTLIVFGTEKVDELTGFLKNKLQGIITDLNSALEIAGEDTAIIFITEPDKKMARLRDVKAVALIPESSDSLFSSILNYGASALISDSHIAPGIIVMRVLGDTEKIMDSIKEAYNGKAMSLERCLDEGILNQTILSFTEKPLNQKLNLEDLKPEHILINMPAHLLFKKLENQALRFLNEGLLGKEWYDLQIRIYDRYSKYKLHYDRLSVMLDNLETSFILGESWSKDHPRFLMSVLVYQLRIFTLMEPVEIKKMLLGMEYLEDGTRIADLDLIYKGRKVDWVETLDNATRGFDRKQLGLKFRSEIMNRLSSDDIEKMKEYDEEVLKSRD